jgi:hypothetical protein
MASCKVRGGFIRMIYARCSRVSSIYYPGQVIEADGQDRFPVAQKSRLEKLGLAKLRDGGVQHGFGLNVHIGQCVFLCDVTRDGRINRQIRNRLSAFIQLLNFGWRNFPLQ